MTLENIEMGDFPSPKVPMTKARAAEITYESLKKFLMELGPIEGKDCNLILNDLRSEFVTTGISDEEIIAFVEFLKNDINESLKKK